MEHVLLNDTLFYFVKGLKHDPDLRTSFNAMTETHFGFSLENWYQAGYWGDYYEPYALLQDNQVVSNVSVNKLNFLIDNEVRFGIQIGTVMTDEKYRHRGLNKYLLQHVLDEWEIKADFIYLFANDTVLDFYPKFGLEPLEEYQYVRPIQFVGIPSLRKLNIEKKEDLALLLQTVNQSVPISSISVRNHAAMILFYGMSFMKDSFYHIQELDVIVVADFEGDTLLLYDVFAKTPIDLNELIQHTAGERARKVVLGFTPFDTSGFESHVVQGPDKLFMRRDRTAFFKNKHWMFPVLSHA